MTIAWTEKDNKKFIEMLNELKIKVEKQKKSEQLQNLNLLMSEIIKKLGETKNRFPPINLIELIQKISIEPNFFSNAFNVQQLKVQLEKYNADLSKAYLKGLTWDTPDKEYQTLLQNPLKFSPKSGGAKNTGARTGQYTFGEGEEKTTMLIKQGADVGETIAEYIGGNLYELTIPEHSAKCILVRDNSRSNATKDDVYVASVYAKADSVVDSFKSVGYESRGLFAGVKARVKKLFGSRESLIRQIIKKDAEETNNSLAMAAASVLFHGDQDFHPGNFVEVIHKDEDKTDKRFYKIDHGFSFFNFDKKVTNIFNPFAGKVFSINPKRMAKGGKLIEFYPTNHFWDFAVESKLFYFNPTFIKACEDIANLTPEAIRANIQSSLEKVTQAYGDNAAESLKVFGKRIGMKSSELKSNNNDILLEKIEDYMVQRLIERQASMQQLADYCKTKSRDLNKDRRKISATLNDKIIECLNRQKIIEQNPNLSDIKKPKKTIRGIFHAYSHLKDPNALNNILKQEIEVLKLVQQANDLGLLTVDDQGKLAITEEFYFHNSGKKEHVTPEEFSNTLDLVQERQADEPFKVPVSAEVYSLLEQVAQQVNVNLATAKKPVPK